MGGWRPLLGQHARQSVGARGKTFVAWLARTVGIQERPSRQPRPLILSFPSCAFSHPRSTETENSRNKQYISFELNGILRSVVNGHAIRFHPTQGVSIPLSSYLHCVSSRLVT